jgi:predicted permease
MHSFLRDIRFAIRQLRKNPGFALVTVLTLGLGIGATTSIFSLVNTVVLRPLPFPESDRIMNVATGRQAAVGAPILPGSFDYPDYFDFRSQNHSFEALASFHDTDVTLTGQGEPRHMMGEVVGADFFRVLRVAPELGRDFTAIDEKPQSNVVVLSHELWQSTFGSRKDVIGQPVTFGGTIYTIIGVMPKGFVFPIIDPAPAFYTTLAIDAYDPTGDTPVTQQRGAHFLEVIGRLKPGVSVASASSDLSLIAANLRKQYPDTNERFPSAVVRPQLERMVGKTRSTLRILFAAVGFVLLIACANVAGLLLARSTQRRAEIAIRSALGAGRVEIVRQILIESLVLAICGGIFGVIVSSASLAALIHLVPQDLPRLAQVSVDRDALFFAFVTAIVTSLIFGGLPAWRMSRMHPSQSIRQGSRTVTADRAQHRLQHALIVAETAIGLVLLIGSALLIHTFVRVLRVDPGFDTHHVLTTELSLPDSSYPGLKIDQFYRQLLPMLCNSPGVISATAGFPMPLSGNGMMITLAFEGKPVPRGLEPAEAIAVVAPDYFKTMHIPIVQGREFQWTDTVKSQAVMLVTQSFARKYYPGENPIGKLVRPGIGDGITKSTTNRQIIGVVADVKTSGLTEDMVPQYYLPLSQALIASPTLVIRTQGDPAAILPTVRAAVASLDPAIPLYSVRTMDEYISRSAAQSRFQAVLLTCFAGIALILFAVGLYAVLSYTVSQRTVEIGVRMALGAKREDMLMMFLKQGLRLTAIGGVIGLIAAFGMTRVIASMLYEVKSFDPSSFLTVPVVIGIVAIGASAVPAIRAMSVDPMTALKDE